MCGITGIIRNQSTLQQDDSNLIDQMSNLLNHRGPDGYGKVEKNNVIFGHKRLSIIDIKGGHQPIYNEDRSVFIVLNGEIYNYQELRTELIKQGHHFSTKSDTEVIVHGYEEWGSNVFKRLNGMFVFALYDANLRRTWIVRDRFGVKPIYIAQNKAGDIAFGSELKALRPFLKSEWSLNPSSLDLYLSFENIPAPFSIIQGVQKLEAGHSLLIQDDQTQKKERYWSISYANKISVPLNEAVQQLDQLLTNSVRLQCQSDVPLGIFLSGGLDSSLIAAIMKKNQSGNSSKIEAYSIAFTDSSFDESKYARQVTKHLGLTSHHVIPFDERDLLNTLNLVLPMQDEPFADPAILPLAFVSSAAKDGLTVALSGDGADELLAGYPTYLARKYSKFIPNFLLTALYKTLSLTASSKSYLSLEYKLKRWTNGYSIKDPNLRHQTWLSGIHPILKNQLYFESNLQYENLIQSHMNQYDGKIDWERSLWSDFRFYLQDNMFVKSDRATMLSSVECRVPFLDNDLVDFIHRLPENFKIHHFHGKWILKKVAESYLPKNIIYRKKHGFGVPISQWLKTNLKEWMMDLTSSESAKKHFNTTVLNQLIQDHLSGKKNYKKELWTILMFLEWERHYGSY